LLPQARSVICAALNYRRPEPPPGPARPPTGRIAAYARGRDYHAVLRGLLAELAGRLRAAVGEPAEFRICVDTAPVLERELAAAAGVGWIGKNTCVIAPRLGSYLFLGELVTTLELAPDAPATDHCGACTRCLEACPTRALFAPYQMDASRCISYLTIEHRGEIPAQLRPQMGDWVYGCDVCQDVCPHNHKAPAAEHPGITAEYLPARIDLRQLVGLSTADYRRLTRPTAARRATRAMWRRNAAIALANENAECRR
jgi:epoxyqueuosine reductase